GSVDYTFAALVGSSQMIEERPETAALAVEAIAEAQELLATDPQSARAAAERHFPAFELEFIAELVAADAPFYDPAISKHQVQALNDFARWLGLTSRSWHYEQVVAGQVSTAVE